MLNRKVLMLAGEGASTNIVFNALKQHVNIGLVIMEEKEDRNYFIKRRIRRLGLLRVIGQILFQLIVVKGLNLLTGNRLRICYSDLKLDKTPIAEGFIKKVRSVNDPEVINVISAYQPDVVVVNGTRIISKKILQALSCPLINTHAGITPGYRGVHGAYWALVKKDPENCGVTVHLIDEGIDTGDILYQAKINVDKSDNFLTYPCKQLAAGIPLLLKAINDAFTGSLDPRKGSGDSGLWYHPTILQYLYYRIFYNVK